MLAESTGIAASNTRSLTPSVVVLKFAKNLKLNLEPLSNETNERFVSRVQRFLEVIDYGASLHSLKIRVSGPTLSAQSLGRILSALSALHTTRYRTEVYIGEVSEEALNEERLAHFIDAIDG
ncbi:hypothetical protein RRF57_005227 [Xylaria bambusicola]|uniref:Uncharacterized protein n=1 Tax=Xylaria bambusicola TaxID=326684 RepID=A0AAN7Z5Q5_9PEZI